jgi:hypothetical protein
MQKKPFRFRVLCLLAGPIVQEMHPARKYNWRQSGLQYNKKQHYPVKYSPETISRVKQSIKSA